MLIGSYNEKFEWDRHPFTTSYRCWIGTLDEFGPTVRDWILLKQKSSRSVPLAAYAFIPHSFPGSICPPSRPSWDTPSSTQPSLLHHFPSRSPPTGSPANASKPPPANPFPTPSPWSNPKTPSSLVTWARRYLLDLFQRAAQNWRLLSVCREPAVVVVGEKSNTVCDSARNIRARRFGRHYRRSACGEGQERSSWRWSARVSCSGVYKLHSPIPIVHPLKCIFIVWSKRGIYTFRRGASRY